MTADHYLTLVCEGRAGDTRCGAETHSPTELVRSGASQIRYRLDAANG
ncbi:hypothetical protein [Streptomyces albidoflavus]|nr:hypothetical protein [Streptomyces albidoflavus]MBF4138142.1 hypothetical protein [Streptomyces albidoflavus]MBZ2410806.1 hypothetical protein [Streptomyces sp. L06]